MSGEIASVQHDQLDTDAYDANGEFVVFDTGRDIHEYDEDEFGGDVESPVLGGQHGEIWIDEDDGDYIYRDGRRMRKPQPRDIAVCVVCSWPLPIRWSWRECEFGDPVFWRLSDDLHRALDDDPLLYRVTPWIWTFCRCNGCVARTRGKGRPSKYCSAVCEAQADNARDRATRRANGAVPRNRNVIKTAA